MHEIRVENLCKAYKAEIVLDNISHTFKPGMIHGIVGRNGSGKTTLLRMICGLAIPTQGTVYISDRQVNFGGNGDFPHDIGVLIETPGFIPQYSGYRNLKYLADIQKKVGKEQIEYAMKQVGLSPSDRKWVGRYSLGMKQRLGIAQAIMENPGVLLLDEPMNGLDKEAVRDMYELFRNLRDHGINILLASHSMDDIHNLCDTVIELDHGHLSIIK